MGGAVHPSFDLPPWFYADLTASIVHPKLLDLRAYLDRIRDREALPNRRAFDPLEVPGLLGNLFVIKVENGGLDFTYTLIGTNIVQTLGRDSTGKRVEDTFAAGHPILEFYRHIARHRIPGRTYGQLRWVAKDFRDFESLMMPMVDDDGRVVKVVGGAYYT
ncbi:MAG: PAS domain-containing protein [Alphaproteobacteria bacterium]|nr:PAS domain-containing protein [Alphaproteobacteria bacterium]